TDQLIPWLQQVQIRQAQVRQYEHSPLVQVQGWSAVPRGTPLFETILVFQNFVDATSGWEERQDLRVSAVRSLERTNYALTLVASPGPELALRLVADSARFDAATAGQILAHVSNLLTSIAENPLRRLGDLSMLSADEW